MEAWVDETNTEEITHNLMEFMKSTAAKPLKLPPQASLTRYVSECFGELVFINLNFNNFN